MTAPEEPVNDPIVDPLVVPLMSKIPESSINKVDEELISPVPDRAKVPWLIVVEPV